MSGYALVTTHGHNMFDMMSLMQKAIRRGDYEKAGFAAYELSEKFRGAMWNRIVTISSEDCWGVVTKEIHRLRMEDKKQRDDQLVSNAVFLLCRCRKSRDACYFACNFVIIEPTAQEFDVPQKDIEQIGAFCRLVPGSVFSNDVFNGFYADIIEIPLQTTLCCSSSGENDRAAARLYNSIKRCDMEAIGAFMDILRKRDRTLLWKTILFSALRITGDKLTKEIISLALTDEIVNGKKKPNEKDEIFLCKAVMLICYAAYGIGETLLGVDVVDYNDFVDWNKYKVKPIGGCRQLGNDEIPEYVYDVHTIKGKKAGKTDWQMNLVEQAALNPMMKAFFEEASWGPRYEYKHQRGMCTQQEYEAYLEYKRTRSGNPVKPLKTSCDTVYQYEQAEELSRLLLQLSE